MSLVSPAQIDGYTRRATTSNVPGILSPALWVRSDVGVTLDGSNNVQSWLDLSGNGNNVTQATAANRPPLVTNQINGWPSVRLNTSDGVTFLNHPLGAVASNFTIWAVVSAGQPSLGAYQCLYGNSAGVTFATFNGASGQPWGIYLNAPISSTKIITSAGDSAYHSITVIVGSTSGTITFSTDGVITTATGSGAYTANAGTIGGGNTAQPFDGHLAELAVWNRQLASTEVQLLESYALARYGV